LERKRLVEKSMAKIAAINIANALKVSGDMLKS